MKNRINIMGCGRAAGSLARLFTEAGAAEIGGILNRSTVSSESAARAVASGYAVATPDDFPEAQFWMIGTSDGQIASAARQLSESRAPLQNAIVFHLCGRHGAEILTPLLGRGCRIAAVHPVRSLTHETISVAEFEGTACVAEGEGDTLMGLRRLFRCIGAVWMPVENIDRGLYHAAVSIISNVTKAVAWKAQNWLEIAGLDPPEAATVAGKLLNSTLEDLSRSSAKHSITGPVVRGDTSTVEAHLDALGKLRESDVDIYRVLARTVLELAQERGDLDEAAIGRFEDLLHNAKVER